MKNNKLILIFLTIIITIYSLVSLFNLGTTKFPNTYVTFEENEELVLDLENRTKVSLLNICSGYNILNYDIYISVDGINFEHLMLNENEYFFHWEDIKIDKEVKSIKIILKQYKELPKSFEKKIYDGNIAYINEIGIFNDKNQLISYGTDYKELNDEQDTVPQKGTPINSLYFDEYYFAKAGYQYANDILDGEIDQPPLGKEIIALGIKMFGMNPFGWRAMGCLAGIFMLGFLFLLTKELFNEKYAIFATALLSLDFMHFVQTRIGTVDSFAVLTLIMTFYFIIKVLKNKNTNINLFLAGTFLGLGCAIKIYCAYAIPVLALFIIYKIYEKKATSLLDCTQFTLCSILAFVFIPILINICSFIPHFIVLKQDISLKYIYDFYRDMFVFHSNSVSTHAFQSEWWQWLFNFRPMLYYGEQTENLYEVIGVFGNPLIWLIGIIALVYTTISAIKTKNEKACVIMLSYASLLLPWLLISRMTFIYHYFSCSIFMILAIVYMFSELSKKMQRKHFYLLVAIIINLSTILFILYFPVLTGMPMTVEYAKNFLIFYPFLNFG